MRIWWIVLALVPGGLVLLLVRWLAHRHQLARFEAKSGPDQIAVLKTDAPIALPPVRELKATKQPSDHRLLRCYERSMG